MDIPALAFENDYVIHAILSIAARDLQLKTRDNQASRSLDVSAIQSGALSMHGLRQSLDRPATLEMFATILMLLWQAMVSNDGKAEVSHCVGAQYVLSRLPDTILQSRLGQELLILYSRLDEMMAYTHKQTSSSHFAISHRTRALSTLKSEAYAHEIRCILTERIALLKSDASFLDQIAKPVSLEQQQGLLTLVRRLCRWYQKVRNEPEFEPLELALSQRTADHPFGSIVYGSTAAAMMMISFCRVMYSLWRNLNYSRFCDYSSLRVAVAVLVRQIFAGALDLTPSTYSETLLGLNGIVSPLVQANEIITSPELRAYQIAMFERLIEYNGRTVWDFQHPVLLEWEQLQQINYFERTSTRTMRCETCFAKAGLMADWTGGDCDEDSDNFAAPGSEINSYNVYARRDHSVYIEVNKTVVNEDGRLSLTHDVEMSALWTRLAKNINFSDKFAGDVEPGAVEEILNQEGLGAFNHCDYTLD